MTEIRHAAGNPRFVLFQVVGLALLVAGGYAAFAYLNQDEERIEHTLVFVPEEMDAATALARASDDAGFDIPPIDAVVLGLELSAVEVRPAGANDEVQLWYGEAGRSRADGSSDDAGSLGMQLTYRLASGESARPPENPASYTSSGYPAVIERIRFDVPDYELHRISDSVRDRELGVGYFLAGDGHVFEVRLWHAGEDAVPTDKQMLPILTAMAES